MIGQLLRTHLKTRGFLTRSLHYIGGSKKPPQRALPWLTPEGGSIKDGEHSRVSLGWYRIPRQRQNAPRSEHSLRRGWGSYLNTVILRLSLSLSLSLSFSLASLYIYMHKHMMYVVVHMYTHTYIHIALSLFWGTVSTKDAAHWRAPN